MTGELVSEMPEAEYHALPGLSSTGAKTLLDSPAKFRAGVRRESRAFDLGTVVHGMVLGTGWPVAVIPDDLLSASGAVSTRAAKEWVAAARERGETPITSADHAQAQAMADAVLAHPVARMLLTRDGQAEVSALWTDDATGVACRGRFDRMVQAPSRTILVDLKTTVDAHPSRFGRTAATFGYDLQAAWYLDGLAAATDDTDAAFVHVLVEKELPFLASVVQLDDDALWTGRQGARLAREVYRDCTESGIWPGYSTDIVPVSLPTWARDRFTRETA